MVPRSFSGTLKYLLRSGKCHTRPAGDIQENLKTGRWLCTAHHFLGVWLTPWLTTLMWALKTRHRTASALQIFRGITWHHPEKLFKAWMMSSLQSLGAELMSLFFPGDKTSLPNAFQLVLKSHLSLYSNNMKWQRDVAIRTGWIQNWLEIRFVSCIFDLSLWWHMQRPWPVPGASSVSSVHAGLLNTICPRHKSTCRPHPAYGL